MKVRWDTLSVAWAAGVLLVTAGFLAFATWPQIKQLSELSDQIEAEHVEQVSGQRDMNAIGELQREVDSLGAQASDLEARIPAREMLSVFVEDLARCTKDRNLRSDSIEPGIPVRSSKITALPITFRVLGPFETVYGLIHDIEQMPRLTQIEHFETEADPENPGNESAEVGLRIFFQAS